MEQDQVPPSDLFKDVFPRIHPRDDLRLPRLVSQTIESGQGYQSTEGGKVQRAIDRINLVLIHPQVPAQEAAQGGRGRRPDFQADTTAGLTQAEDRLHLVQEILGIVLFYGKVGVAGDTENIRFGDAFLREILIEKMENDVFQQ